jgi:putative hemolysin
LLPPLLKGYKRLGAKIAGEPAIDLVFQTIDFFVVLDTENINSKYRNHFLS